MIKFLFSAITALLFAVNLQSQTEKYSLQSPNGTLTLLIEQNQGLLWSLNFGQTEVVIKSPLEMQLADNVIWNGAFVESAETTLVSEIIEALFYKKSIVADNYNQLVLNCKGNYGICFRLYNDGMAYRFFTSSNANLTILNELAAFNFSTNHKVYVPYVNNPHLGDMFQTSFENGYEHVRFSEIVKDTLAFVPVMVVLPKGLKAVITEADLEDYPGMFLKSSETGYGFSACFAPYPTEEKQGGHNNLQMHVVKRAGYIAKTQGARTFPWRTVIVSTNDVDLLNNDMVYRLASPSRIADTKWIKPGKVAWDWWNDWNISGVNFKAGINTETYKFYIDFAAGYGIEYILLDEGWAESSDIIKIVPQINLQEILDYAKAKNVGVWLWGGWLPLDRKTDEAFSTYSKMGIKGFKVDFMDRDDQKMVQFYYKLAQKAAQYQLMLDFHGAYKPTGLQRTYPNVLTFEGVRGLEYAKWSSPDFPEYDCSIPFLRMIAGPMDYTPGAMKNASNDNFRAIFSAPMSQGTRCHQLAMYILFESPFAMLADNPVNYQREAESARFIASIPTTFDETIALNGEMAQYATIARKKNNNWYVGAITNWQGRTLEIDLSFLNNGVYEAEIFEDGINANREGTDYNRIIEKVQAPGLLKLNLAPGGGWAAKFIKIE